MDIDRFSDNADFVWGSKSCKIAGHTSISACGRHSTFGMKLADENQVQILYCIYILLGWRRTFPERCGHGWYGLHYSYCKRPPVVFSRKDTTNAINQSVDRGVLKKGENRGKQHCIIVC